ncbi:MAG: M48 family metalloprotease [Alphaproteobacteria bacterium]
MTHLPSSRYRRLPAVLSAFALLLTACSVNPATGERDFTAFMSPEKEVEVGREQHPKIIEQFGGVYDDPKVTAYVNRVGQSLARVSELPDLQFTFTVLNDDIVNAFALPGGFVYISRGLLGLANTEAELAGVLGHEIGHVTGRHSAQRYSTSVLAQGLSVGAGILGSVFLGTSEIGQAVGQGSSVYLQSFSREHEFEADTLGVRYLARAGYSTDAMASFLASLQAYSALEAKVSGLPDPASRYNIMSTHPRTQDRVVAATRAANIQQVPNPQIGNRDYLNAINGIVFGDSPAAQTAALTEDFRRTTFSFRKLNRADRNRYKPWRVATKVVGRRDTVSSLSRNMPMPGPKEEWFRILNGLQPGSQPFPGQTVKVIVE